ncbi:PLP-dependent aminotransferase family protein [Nakamurella sp. PAMC28650]|uniref:aminotransferase-like domain-containing protein n=1 Tax=Nakamurella sp. PAMC28650 TaxID=2762325 RepID=UPI00164E1733|nr:aminotransferase class I/II-fold pyridoxal phosphate-dependent enzyme [Nakamurella sp. PAMC28650]QNK80221.1 aminotransferase class I/II-fold pyridoxal phosphate-dependent enzyme [Nakamurella sp. PAMC28650]
MMQELRSRLRLPTSRGLADAVSGAIRDQVLLEGDRLPPIRAVAKALNLSPTTVNAAWALLVRGGLLHTDGRRGTVVAIRTGALGKGGGAADRSAGLTRYRQAVDRTSLFELDLATGVPDPLLLPDLSAALQQIPDRRTVNSYLDDAALPALVEVLRHDWPYTAGRFAIVDGAMDAIQQIASQLLRFGDKVVVEHPAFPPLLDLLESMGIAFVGVGLDGSGMLAAELAAAITADVKVVFLQPRAHNPTGISYSAERITELAAILRRSAVIVVEDDSAGAISSSPAVSIGSHLPEQTLHIRSFSKSHGPDLRLAAMSGPVDLVDRISERRRLGQGWTSRLLQSVLLHLLVEPESLAQVEHARATYARRREDLVQDLSGLGVQVAARDGINLWLPVKDETAALLRLAAARIGAAAGRPFSARPDEDAHLRVTCGLVASHHEEVAAELGAATRMWGWREAR